MSAHFGHSFADVRIHADERADTAASSRRSLAFTDGEHVFFRAGQYQPFTGSGQRLIAHELAHTLQRRTTRRGLVSSAVDSEKEARGAALSFAAGRPAEPIHGALAGVGLQSDMDAGFPSGAGIADANAPIAGVPPQADTGTPPQADTGNPSQGDTGTPLQTAPLPCGTVTCPTPQAQGLLPVNPHIPSGSLCRGACGPDCPTTCTPATVMSFSAPDSTGRCHSTCTYTGVRCGSHLGCREHDDCYDAANGWLAHRSCDAAAVQKYGVSNTNSWRTGGGPYDSFLSFYNLGVATSPVPN